jgi:hypothetical protein
MRLAADENLNDRIVRGLVRRRPGLDLKRVSDAGLRAEDDLSILEWAASEERVLLTHDRATMSNFAYARTTEGKRMPGLVVVESTAPIGQLIDEILLLVDCSQEGEWEGKVIYLPLR